MASYAVFFSGKKAVNQKRYGVIPPLLGLEGKSSLDRGGHWYV